MNLAMITKNWTCTNVQLGVCVSCKTQQHLRIGMDTRCVFCNKEGVRPTGRAFNGWCFYLLMKAAAINDVIDARTDTEGTWRELDETTLSLLKAGIDIRPHMAIH